MKKKSGGSMGGSRLGDALKTQVDLSNRLTKAEKRFEDHKELFLEAYEVLAGIMAWYSENNSQIESLPVWVVTPMHNLMKKAGAIAKKAVVI